MATPLMMCEDAEIGALLLDHGADMYETDEHGHNSIMIACTRESTDMLSLFINRGADVFRPTEAGETGLMLASAHGCVAVVNMLLQTEGVTKQWVNTVSDIPFNALGLAAVRDHVECVAALIALVKLLLEAGAVDTPRCDGVTALMLACSVDNWEAVELLIEHKSDVNAADHDGFTPLMLGAGSGGKAVPMLLDAGADPRTADNHGRVPLMHAVNADTFAALVEAAPDTISRRDSCGRTTFHYYSASRAKLDALLRLYRYIKIGEHRIGINDRDDNGDTALHMAMADSNSGAVKLLLKNGAEVLGSGYEGSTVLMKPFLDAEVISRVYEGLEMSRDDMDEDDSSGADRSTCTCLCRILDGKKKASQGSRSRRRGNGQAGHATKKKRT
jgi:ankyrin repeat protein